MRSLLQSKQAKDIFSNGVFNEILRYGRSKRLDFYIKNSELGSLFKKSNSLAQFFNSAYESLIEINFTEYFIKSKLIKQLLDGTISISADAILGEFRVEDSRADIVVLNGTSAVFEIKTQHDKLDKISSQISNYSRFFDKIYTVIDPSHQNRILKMLPDHVGIIHINKDGPFQIVRKCRTNKKNVDRLVVLRSLRQSEVVLVLEHFFGFKNTLPNTEIYTYAADMFLKIPNEKLHDFAVKLLKKRVKDINLVKNSGNDLQFILPFLVDRKFDFKQAEKLYDAFSSIKLGAQK